MEKRRSQKSKMSVGLERALYAGVSTTYLYPSVDNIILWLDRVHVLALVKVIGCYHDNWRYIELFSKIVYLSGEHKIEQRSDWTEKY